MYHHAGTESSFQFQASQMYSKWWVKCRGHGSSGRAPVANVRQSSRTQYRGPVLGPSTEKKNRLIMCDEVKVTASFFKKLLLALMST
jgi:hypothetical protein